MSIVHSNGSTTRCKGQWEDFMGPCHVFIRGIPVLTNLALLIYPTRHGNIPTTYQTGLHLTPEWITALPAISNLGPYVTILKTCDEFAPGWVQSTPPCRVGQELDRRLSSEFFKERKKHQTTLQPSSVQIP
jgi:hypothetical protein